MLITGTSCGIGLLTPPHCSRRGAKVMLLARDKAALRRAVDDVGAAGGSAAVGGAAQLARAADQAIALWGRIDGWVHDAGVGIVARLADTPLAEHHRIFRTNYFGVVSGATIAVGRLREGGDALITAASSPPMCRRRC